MLIIDSPSTDAYFNIASEEYLLSKYPQEEVFLLYVNAPSIIIGKFQNTLAEINLDYIDEHAIKVVRRMSGGGAVYHDLGNLNFSFHTVLASEDFTDFSTFTEPIITVLDRLGVPAKLEGRNDLVVKGRKFSGNAKLMKNGKVIQHGTLLINSEMQVLGDALKVNPLKYVDKAIKSNRARVTNLREYLPPETTTEMLKSLLIEEVLTRHQSASAYSFTKQDIEGINRLVEEKYKTWDWNYGFSPNYNLKKAIKVVAGFIELHMDVDKGYIHKIKIFGDFFASKPIEEFEQLFMGHKHQKDEILGVIHSADLQSYFGKVTVADIFELFR